MTKDMSYSAMHESLFSHAVPTFVIVEIWSTYLVFVSSFYVQL